MDNLDIEYINSSLVNSRIAALLFVDSKTTQQIYSKLTTFGALCPVAVTFQSLTYPASYSKVSCSQIKPIVDYILSDSNAYLIAERLLLGSYLSSISQQIDIIEAIVANTLSLIHAYRLNKFIQTNVPHNVDWFVAKVFEFLGLPVLYTRSCNPVNKVQLVSGVTEPRAIQAPIQCPLYQAKTEADAVIARYSSSYDQAIPDYERKHIQARGEHLMSIKSVIADLRRAKTIPQFLLLAFSIYQKYRLYSEYIACSSSVIDKTPIITFFMHCQPEATTIPAGCTFAVQGNAIKQLSIYYSDSAQIFIREHPSTFRLTFDPRYRWKSYYSNLSSLQSVQITSIIKNVFADIDRSSLVCTITGNVGFESLCRGIHCLVFADTFYSNMHGAFKVDRYGITPKLVGRIRDMHFSPALFESSLVSFLRTTYELDQRLNGSLDATVYLCNWSVF